MAWAGVLHIQRTNHVLEYVADPDWLRSRTNPARTDHDRQALRQVTDHFKRQAARPNDNGCAKFGDWYAHRLEFGILPQELQILSLHC